MQSLFSLNIKLACWVHYNVRLVPDQIHTKKSPIKVLWELSPRYYCIFWPDSLISCLDDLESFLAGGKIVKPCIWETGGFPGSRVFTIDPRIPKNQWRKKRRQTTQTIHPLVKPFHAPGRNNKKTLVTCWGKPKLEIGWHTYGVYCLHPRKLCLF